VKPQVFTSGYFQEKRKRIKEIKPYISSIKVTIRSSDPKKDSELRGRKNSFENSVEVLEICKELKIPICIHFVVDKDTVNEINDMEKLAKKYNARLIKLPFLPFFGSKNITERFDYDVLKEYPPSLCPAGILRLAIDINGNVSPCIYIREKFGNIFTDDLIKIEKRMREWRLKWGECKGKCIAKEILMKNLRANS
jgi:radical SAM protein with 4Fe4S-binding SPASM domain